MKISISDLIPVKEQVYHQVIDQTVIQINNNVTNLVILKVLSQGWSSAGDQLKLMLYENINE